jgi:hypothetical protein
MSQSRLLLSLYRPCDEALLWADQQFKAAGMLSMQTFDLKVARSAQAYCTCPHHGTDDCTCQVVFLLVYNSQSQTGNELEKPPVTLEVHGHDDQTWFYIVDNAQQRADPRMEACIRKTLIPNLEDSGLGWLAQAA